MFTLFPDEKVLVESDGKRVILTTHRVGYEYKEWGKSYNQTIMLENITSCELDHQSKPFLLVLSVLGGIGAAYGLFVNHVSELILPSLLASGVFFFLWQRSSASLVRISTPSSTMRINVSGMPKGKVQEFIGKVEHARNDRMNSLR